jgi:hypothetical protein
MLKGIGWWEAEVVVIGAERKRRKRKKKVTKMRRIQGKEEA